ncbi:hypothetical protein EST38_g4382 [Candolleomyces aberdarensis]|uniref:Uncharacterized protein n=1 Tax=Candolleomyces aberdarensis TaxID=2316362 RepID=A0A4Q2DR46_9AGAR|nr:hypothetical protein EST38_g4382 [Candolleomyces aberdarensis]
MDLFKGLFGFRRTEDDKSQRNSMQLDRAVEAITKNIPDVDLAYLEDFVANLLPAHGLDRTIKMTVDYLKDNPDYLKFVHYRDPAGVRVEAIQERDSEDLGDEEHSEHVVDDDEGESNFEGDGSDGEDGESFGGQEADGESSEDGVSDGELVPYAEVNENEQEREREHVVDAASLRFPTVMSSSAPLATPSVFTASSTTLLFSLWSKHQS